jgi:hypothetical protein
MLKCVTFVKNYHEMENIMFRRPEHITIVIPGLNGAVYGSQQVNTRDYPADDSFVAELDTPPAPSDHSQMPRLALDITVTHVRRPRYHVQVVKAILSTALVLLVAALAAPATTVFSIIDLTHKHTPFHVGLILVVLLMGMAWTIVTLPSALQHYRQRLADAQARFAHLRG